MERFLSVLPAQEVWVGAGLLTYFAVAVRRGSRDRFEPLSVGAFAGGVGLVGVVAARLLWLLTDPHGPILGGASWATLYDVDQGGFASFGALFGGGIAACSARLRLESGAWRRRLDAIVPAGFLGLAVARLGCLSAGCDFGRRTLVAWAIEYPPGTAAYSAHLARGWIEPGAVVSAPTHPIPLYLALVAGTAALAGDWSETSGAAAWLSASVYCGGRFVVEFYRSPLTDIRFADGWIGLNQIWSVVGLVTVAAIALRNFDIR